jgi:hypothetical protein
VILRQRDPEPADVSGCVAERPARDLLLASCNERGRPLDGKSVQPLERAVAQIREGVDAYCGAEGLVGLPSGSPLPLSVRPAAASQRDVAIPEPSTPTA